MMIDRPLADHPYAACYPLVSGVLELSLLESIRQHGLRQPIVLWEDQERDITWIIDGRNRYRALMEIQEGVRSDQVVWKTYTTDEEVRLAVLDYNENRRQMTTAQKSIVAGRILQARESLQGETEEDQGANQSTLTHESQSSLQSQDTQSQDPQSQDTQDSKEEIDLKEHKKAKRMANQIRKQVASTLGIGPQTAQKGSQVVHRGVPELIHALEQGDLSLEAAYRLTQLEDTEIQTLVSEGKESIKTRVKAMKQKEKEASNPSSSQELNSKIKTAQTGLSFDHLPAQDSQIRLSLSFIEGGKEMSSQCVIDQTEIRDLLLQHLVNLELLRFSKEPNS